MRSKLIDLKFDYFDIKNIFTFLTIYFICIPFLFEISLITLIAFSIAAIGSLSFFYGNATKKYFSVCSFSAKKNRYLTVVGIIFLVIDIVRGYKNLMSTINIDDYTAGFYVEDYDVLYLQILAIIVFAIKYFTYAVLMSRSKKIYILIFASQVLIVYNSPTRLVALQPFIIFIIYGYYMSYLNLNIIKIVTALILLPFVAAILLLSRGHVENENYFNIVSNVIATLDFEGFRRVLKVALESFQSFEYFSKIVAENYVHLESGILRMVFMPISRSVWPDKPESISRIISNEYNTSQYIDGGGSAATIFGDFFINGHVLGVILLMFLVGMYSKIIYNTLRKNIDSNATKKSIVVMIYGVYIYDFIYFFRGFFSEFYWKTVVFQLCFYLLLKIFFTGRLNKIALDNHSTIG